MIPEYSLTFSNLKILRRNDCTDGTTCASVSSTCVKNLQNSNAGELMVKWDPDRTYVAT